MTANGGRPAGGPASGPDEPTFATKLDDAEFVLDMPLDPGIARWVHVLRAAGVETFESCQGGAGHAFREPTIRFFGGQGAGHHALGVALLNALPVSELRRVWSVEDGAPTGPQWALTFSRAAAEGDGCRSELAPPTSAMVISLEHQVERMLRGERFEIPRGFIGQDVHQLHVAALEVFLRTMARMQAGHLQ